MSEVGCITLHFCGWRITDFTDVTDRRPLPSPAIGEHPMSKFENSEAVAVVLEPDRTGPSGYTQPELDAARLDAARLGYGVGLRPARARA
jgi:hypothetical protein